MGITLSFGDRPTFTPHDAIGVAVLLDAVGTPAAVTAAAKLSEQATTEAGQRQVVSLTNDEKSALLDALSDLPHRAKPAWALSVISQLAAELGR